MIKSERQELERGVGFSYCPDDRFKTEYLCLNFIREFKAEENSVAQVLPGILMRGSEMYESSMAINAALEAVYDAEFSCDTYTVGNIRLTKFSISWISSRYLLNSSNSSNDFDITDKVLEIFASVICAPLYKSGLLSDEFVHLEKASLLDAARSLSNNKERHATKKCREMMLEGDPSGHPKFGTEEEIISLTPSTVTKYYNDLCLNSAIELSYVGDSNENDVISKLRAHLGKLISPKPVSVSDFNFYSPAMKVETRNETEFTEMDQTILAKGYYVPHRPSGDYSRQLFCEILSSSPVSRLFMNVRERLGICYYCRFYVIPSKDVAIMSSGLEYSRCDELVSAVENEIRDIAEGNISDEEMSSARSAFENSLRSVYDSQSLIEDFFTYSLLTKRKETPEEIIKIIKSTTVADVAEYAKGIVPSCRFVLTGGKNK